MERETDSMYPNNPFNYKKPKLEAERMPWPRPMSGKSKTTTGKSNSRIARNTGIKFGVNRKKRS